MGALAGEIICLSDYIVPGHGQTFRVTREMKDLNQCNRLLLINQKSLNDTDTTALVESDAQESSQ